MNSGENTKDVSITKSDYQLNTFITITLYGTDDEAKIEEVFRYIDKLEKECSIYEEKNDLTKIKEAKGQKVEVSEATIMLIKESFQYAEYAKGLFDITSAPLIDLWGITTENPRVPTQKEIQAVLDMVNYHDVEINKNTVRMGEGMYLNLGAIAKGYIADKTAEKLESMGIYNALLNFGGNIYTMGTKPDGTNYNIGIQEPGNKRNSYFGIYKGSKSSIVTSGTYERYFEEAGIRYHHILNPKTGYPVETDLVSVTIVSDSSMEGDALSTTVLLLGFEEGVNLIKKLDGVEAIFVTSDHSTYITENIEADFVMTEPGMQYKVVANEK